MHGNTAEKLKLEITTLYSQDFDSEKFLTHWMEIAEENPMVDTLLIFR